MTEKKEPKLQQVEVVEGRGWTGGPYGSKAEGDRFDYDIEGDPAQLVELGLVKVVASKGADKAASTGSGQA